MTRGNAPSGLPVAGDELPVTYDRPPEHGIIEMRDVRVPMRDGTQLCIDVYRPDTDTPMPALLAFAIYNKDLQGPDLNRALPPQPAWAPLWAGLLEAGDTDYLVPRGYVHVIGSPRGVGKSDGGGSREWDAYDLIEWIAAQDWCDGKVGMVGISGFGAEQLDAAKKRPPSLKAIFPFDPRGALGTLGSFREEYPGGVLHLFRYLIGHFSAFHQDRGAPGDLPPAREALWREAMENPDYRMYPQIFNVVAQKGQHMPAFFNLLIDPYDDEAAVARAEAAIGQVEVPVYTGSGWYAYTYKTHLNGAQTWFDGLTGTKKLLFLGPAHLPRPFAALNAEILRWNDKWLKGIDTGITDEPPVRYWVMGENRWREAGTWPPEGTSHEPLHLASWGRLAARPAAPASIAARQAPDAFVQMPLSQTDEVQALRYASEPLADDLLIAGPSELVLHAALDAEDTNWIVRLLDIGPDPHVRTAREGERRISPDLPERELTRGWLKASLRALDEGRSRPGAPWHRLTREARSPVIPGEVVEYRIGLLATANLFRAGHRIGIEIAAMDVPTGVGGATNAEYIPYHICSSQTVLHKIYRDALRPSRLLLPVVRREAAEKAQG